MAFSWINIYWMAVSILLCVVCSQSKRSNNSSFREEPQSVQAIVGSIIEFRCQAAVRVDVVTWCVNGKPWTHLVPPNATSLSIRDRRWHYALNTLQMPALQEYNNSIFQCVLITFSQPNIISNEVTLVVEASVNATLGSSVQFHCQSLISANTISWYINHTPAVNLSHSKDIDISFSTKCSRNCDSIISIQSIEEHNGTIIQCVARHENGKDVFSDEVTLGVQGTLSAVRDLRVSVTENNYIYVTWRAPFSLDITNMDPDIWYSLSIFDVTREGNKSAMACNDCHSFIETSYNFTVPYSSFELYEITIVALNAVGESVPVVGYFYSREKEVIKTVSKTVCPGFHESMPGIGMGIALGIIATSALVLLAFLCVCTYHRCTNYFRIGVNTACKELPPTSAGRVHTTVDTMPNEAYEVLRKPQPTGKCCSATNASFDQENIYEHIV